MTSRSPDSTRSLGVIRNLVSKLNDALGSTSIVVTHDVQEALDIVDYVYYLSEGVMVAHGTPNRYAPLRIRGCINSSGARRKARSHTSIQAENSAKNSSLFSRSSIINVRNIGHHAIDSVLRLGYATRFFA